MAKRVRINFAVFPAIIVATVAHSVALGGNVLKNATSTGGGFPTWDSDLINVERVPQTGPGVCVAVLDTGLVPNWRDYFPVARVATELGDWFRAAGDLQGEKPGPVRA